MVPVWETATVLVLDPVELGVAEALAICCWTVELNVPVIPLRVNLAENERYGLVGEVGLLSVMEEKRIKYWSLFAPTVASGVNMTVWICDTLIDCG